MTTDKPFSDLKKSTAVILRRSRLIDVYGEAFQRSGVESKCCSVLWRYNNLVVIPSLWLESPAEVCGGISLLPWCLINACQ